MLVQLLLAFVGEAVFKVITARHRGFQAEMERHLERSSDLPLERRPLAPLRGTPSAPAP